jgi:hypothetical protein
MPVGKQVSRAELDAMLGQVLADLNRDMERVNRLADYVRGIPTATLVDAGTDVAPGAQIYNYTAAEEQLMKDAMADMNLIYKIYKGNQPLPAVNDFTKQAKKLWGFGGI